MQIFEEHATPTATQVAQAETNINEICVATIPLHAPYLAFAHKVERWNETGVVLFWIRMAQIHNTHRSSPNDDEHRVASSEQWTASTHTPISQATKCIQRISKRAIASHTLTLTAVRTRTAHRKSIHDLPKTQRITISGNVRVQRFYLQVFVWILIASQLQRSLCWLSCCDTIG